MFSYVLHRTYTFRSDPYVRWVQMPAAFVGVASSPALVDVAVLRSVYAARGFDTDARARSAPRLVALLVAATVRLVLYRAVLLQSVRQRLHERVARPPAPGVVRATVVVPALDEAVGIGATVGRPSATRSPRSTATAASRSWWSTTAPPTAPPTPRSTAGADQVVVLPANRGKGAAVRAGVAGRPRAHHRLHRRRPRLLARPAAPGARAASRTGGTSPSAAAATRSRRRVQGAGALRDLGSRAVNLLAMAVLLSHPHDTQCGLKAFRSDVAKPVFALGRVDRFAFDIEVLHLVERHGWTVVEVPVQLTMGERTTVRLRARHAAPPPRPVAHPALVRHRAPTSSRRAPCSVRPPDRS